MGKSFGEILSDSFAVIKRSYIDLLKICGVLLGGICLGMFATYLLMGKDFVMNMHNSAYVKSYLATQPGHVSVILLLISLFFFVLSYISYSWVILVVRNNILVDKSFLKEAFVETIKKFWKIFLTVCLLWTVYFIIFLIGLLIVFFAFYKQQQHVLLGLVIFGLWLFITISLSVPSFFTTFSGVLCRNGKFWTIFWESFRLGFRRWFKIVGYMILIFLICGAIMGIGLSAISGLFMVLHLEILAIILYYIFQTIFGLFLFCFYTVFYLDLDKEKFQEEVRVVDEIVIDPNFEQQAIQNIEQKPAEDTEPPHMDILK